MRCSSAAPSLHRVRLGAFPGFVGTMSNSDFSPTVPLRFCRSLRGTDRALCLRSARRRAPRRGPGLGDPVSIRDFDRNRRDLLGSQEALAHVPRSQTPARSARPPFSACRCCLPPWKRRRPSRRVPFRGSITRPACSLCTLRSRGRPRPRNTHYRLAGQPWPGGTLTRWAPLEVSAYVVRALHGFLLL